MALSMPLIQNPADARTGKRLVAPVQANQAKNAIQTTFRPPNMNIKPVAPVVNTSGVPSIGSPATAMLGDQTRPMITPARPRSAMDPAALASAAPANTGTPAPIQTQVPTTNTPPAASAPAPPTMGTGQGGTQGTDPQLEAFIQQIQNMSGYGWDDARKARMIAQIRSNPSVMDNSYSYTPPATDPRTNAALDSLTNPANINAVGEQPTNPGRFDNMLNQFQNQPSTMDVVKSNMGSFMPSINLPGQGEVFTPGTRSADVFNNVAGNMGNTAAPLPGRESGASIPGQVGSDVNAGQSGASNAATQGALSAAQSLQKAGVVDPAKISELARPFIEEATKAGNVAFNKGSGLLNRASGAGVSSRAIGDMSNQIAGDTQNKIGSYLSDLTREQMGLASQNLNSAAGAFGNVAGTENQRVGTEAGVKLENRGQNINQRGQDIDANLKNATMGIQQRGDDMNFLTQNADRMLKENLGMADIDVRKYLGEGGLDIDRMRADIEKQAQARGDSREDAKLLSDNFFKGLDSTMAMTAQDRQQFTQMADLAQRADQGDVQAGLQHAGQMLDQAVASGQLDNANSQLLLDNLYKYWNDPQQFAIQWRNLRDQYDVGMAGIKANKPKSQLGIGVGPFSVNIPV